MTTPDVAVDPLHLTPAELAAGLPTIRDAPKHEGTLELIVRRPAVEEREVVEEAELDVELGLVGDSWSTRSRSGGRPPNTKAQVTVMNARSTALVARERERWPLAGDQLYVDFDIGGENLPPGSRLQIGSAVLEVTDDPHTGCKKFSSRFGLDALIFVNSQEGRALNLRGINTRVVEPGKVRMGDPVRKL